MDLQHWLGEALASVERWQAPYGPFDQHAALEVTDARMAPAFADLTRRLQDNYPFFHPSYAGQMLKPPHPAAVVGYLTAMLVNPNNHALDGGPATAAMEKEVVADLAAMFGYGDHLGHLTTSGTIANLEALYVARESHPGRGIAYSAEAHYTHGRMCGVLGMAGTAIPTDGAGRMDLDALAAALAGGGIGTVVATAGTTGLGAVDPVHEIVALAAAHGARVHVDAAYGGFFMLLKDSGLDRPGAVERGPARGLGRRRPSQARAAAVRVRRRAVPRPLASGGSTCTTRRTPTSPPTSCTWARSAWSARAPAPPLRRCGSPCSCCRRPRTASARYWRPADGRRCTGPT